MTISVRRIGPPRSSSFEESMGQRTSVIGVALACLVVVACGDDGNRVPLPDAPAPDAGVPSLELFAGDLGGDGNVDGTGNGARFSFRFRIATDSAGNVYVADMVYQKIRKITPAGVVTTLAGSGALGSADGTGAAATFNNPTGVAIDGVGTIYVADSSNQTIRRVTSAGVVTTLAG